MSRCCYCDKALSDVRAKFHGYGETCASHWGLPFLTEKQIAEGHTEKTKSFAEVYAAGLTLQGFMSEIRDNPYDPDLWTIMGDYLKDNDCFIEVKAPTKGVTIPRE
jgi:hypothetical protein